MVLGGLKVKLRGQQDQPRLLKSRRLTINSSRSRTIGVVRYYHLTVVASPQISTPSLRQDMRARGPLEGLTPQPYTPINCTAS